MNEKSAPSEDRSQSGKNDTRMRIAKHLNRAKRQALLLTKRSTKEACSLKFTKMSDVRILGQRLGQRIGQEAIVLGNITGKSQSNPSYIEITTTDDIRINVMLPQPFDGDASGFIEVRGTVKSKSTMACDSFICFSANMTKDFDAKGYNTVVHTRWAVGDQFDGMFHKD